MSKAQMAWAYGLDEGQFRVSNAAYRGGNGRVSYPSNVVVRSAPADMPQAMYNLVRKGIEAQHAAGVLNAYRDAAAGLVKPGTTVPIDLPPMKLDELGRISSTP
jgi:hypothetical protein